nr:hypothetical protein [Nanoarchaeum sp.]
MAYVKERTGMTQDQVVENLMAIFTSDYFGGYKCEMARFSSDLLSTNLVAGRNELRVADITNTFVNCLQAASGIGTLSDVFVELRPSDEMLKSMRFDENEIGLPLSVLVNREVTTENPGYRFGVLNLGLKQDYVEYIGLNFKEEQAKVNQWYREVTRNLNKILPYAVSARVCIEQ